MNAPLYIRNLKMTLKVIFVLSILTLSTSLSISQTSAPTLDQNFGIAMFMQIGDIRGESQEKEHKDWIELMSYEWAIVSSGDVTVGTGSSAGQVEISDFFITKLADKSSPQLAQAALQGEHFPTVTIELIRTSSEKSLKYITYEFENVIISSFYQTASVDGAVFEALSLAFEKITYTYYPVKSDGTLGTPNEFSYDPSGGT